MQKLCKSDIPWQCNASQADKASHALTFLLEGLFWHRLLVVCQFLIMTCLDRLVIRKSKQLNQSAIRLRDLFIALGPTFIKLGQFLAIRRDLVPQAIADQLAGLQDKAPAFALSAVKETIERELGRRAHEICNSIDPEPIACASLGQVHRLFLPNGSPAVIKVQRPGLTALLTKDIRLMRSTVRIAGRLGWLKIETWFALIDQFACVIFAEMNYLQEGKSAYRLRQAFRDYPQVKIPRVHWKYTAHRVITFEYLPGVRIDNLKALKAANLNLRQLANLLVKAYLQQIVFNGFFHADPHPGNLAVDPNGDLIIYDFGMMAEFEVQERLALIEGLMAISQSDSEKLAQCLWQIGILINDQCLPQLACALKPFLDYYHGESIERIDFQQVESEWLSIIEQKAIIVPANLLYLIKTIISVEGVARTLKPAFNFAQCFRSFLQPGLLKQLM